MATVTDSFTYSNGSLATVSGGVWANVLTSMDVTSNAVFNHGTSDAVCKWTSNTFTNDQDSQVVAVALPTASTDGGPVVRCQSGAASFYLADFSIVGGSYNIAIFKCTAGSFLQIGSTQTGAATGAINDVLKLVITGTTLTPSVNGVNKTTQTDGTFSTGVPGMHLSGSTTTPSWDNWQSTAAIVASGPAARSLIINQAVSAAVF